VISKKPRPKKCQNKECGRLFTPDRPFKKGCCISCEVVIGLAAVKKYKAAKALKERKAKAEEKRADKERLARMKPGYLAGLAQEAINAYARARDYEQGCISCDKDMYWGGQWHAGHLKTRGANSFLRFHLWNLNKQCSVCNNHQSGNVAEHERGIVKRYGQERLDFLNNSPKSKRYSDDYLIRLAKIFRKKTRMTLKRKGICNGN
jgi:hypothetical protein